MEFDFKKYGKLNVLIDALDISNLKGDNLQVFEKVDGGNCQIRKTENNQIIPGSRGKPLKGKFVIGRVPWFQNFLRWTYGNSSIYSLPSDKVVFGEWSGNHTIQYDPQNVNQFFLLDVFDLNDNTFMPYEQAVSFIKDSGMEQVRFLRTLAQGRLEPSEVERLLLNEPSDFYSGSKEGLVVKNYSPNSQMFSKLLHPDFAELKRMRDGTIDFLTPARFRKNYHKLLEESEDDVSRDGLTRQVLKDVQEEGGKGYGFEHVAKRLRTYLTTGQVKLDI